LTWDKLKSKGKKDTTNSHFLQSLIKLALIKLANTFPQQMEQED